jgi:hypothetical protein
MKFQKSKENLRAYGSKIFSYDTFVAEKSNDQIFIVDGYQRGGDKWTKTTSQHIHYVSRQWACPISQYLIQTDKPKIDDWIS